MCGRRCLTTMVLYYVLKFLSIQCLQRVFLVCAFCIKLPIYISVVRLILLPGSFIHSIHFIALLSEKKPVRRTYFRCSVSVGFFTKNLSNQPSNSVIGFSFSVFSLSLHIIYWCCFASNRKRKSGDCKQPLNTIWSIMRIKDTIQSTLQYYNKNSYKTFCAICVCLLHMQKMHRSHPVNWVARSMLNIYVIHIQNE